MGQGDTGAKGLLSTSPVAQSYVLRLEFNQLQIDYNERNGSLSVQSRAPLQ